MTPLLWLSGIGKQEIEGFNKVFSLQSAKDCFKRMADSAYRQ
jgi:hypothetical protein